MTTDPWKDLADQRGHSSLSARRISVDTRWNFYWGKGLDNRCLLVLAFSSIPPPQTRTPRLKGIEIIFTDEGDNRDHILTLKLIDTGQKDVFYRLCMDIVAAASLATTETEAVNLVLARTWRWHHLLRGGVDARLSAEEQKGLIGELLILEEILLPLFSAMDSVSAWHGPLGAPKDFEVDRIAIESKARRGAATPYVAISSEHQLSTDGVDQLFLYVCELDRASENSNNGFTLPDIAGRIVGAISQSDQGAAVIFQSLLVSVGFRAEDDYSCDLWLRGSDSFYLVDDSFPRIVPEILKSGVANVHYSISLPECVAFIVEQQFVEQSLLGKTNGD
jgi:hypothetical protein